MYMNWTAIVTATFVQFIGGFIWYGPLFGTLWGKIHGFDKLSKEVQKKMMREMGPYYGAQFALTLITSFVLSLFYQVLPKNWNIFGMSGLFWLGFMFPSYASSTIFSGIDKK